MLNKTRANTISELAILYRYLIRNSRDYVAGGLLLIGTNSLALAIPWLLKMAVDSFRNPSAAGRTPAFFASLIILAAIAQAGVRILSRTVLLNIARQIEYHIREELYARLISLDLPYFSRERTGDVLSRFSNDLTNVRMLMGFGILNVINTIVVYIAGIALMSRISTILTICAVIPFPVMILVVKRMSGSMFRRSKRAQEELALMSSKVEENVSAATLIRAYCREQGEIEAFRRISDDYVASQMGMARLRGLMIPLMGATGALGTLIILFIGGSRVIAGELTLGEFVAFNGYLAMLLWPTVMMGWILSLMQRGAASMSRLNHVLAARPTVFDPREPAKLDRIVGEVELRKLSFAYDADYLLQEISLKIGKGTRVGVVGAVGSGKSTLARLIPRLYPVADGTLFVDGVDVNSIPLRQLRESIGFVSQESFLFSRTIADNIAYGREGASRNEIEEAARLAGLATDVERFPDGYDTMVGERGVTLSGGQKQRVAIARALLKNPAILILDDPLSAVDTRTEEAIVASLASDCGKRTILMISHRLSALRDCDLIVVLEKGRIVERGTHEELSALDGRYAATWREQQLRAEIETF